jgi:hypothetical protein
VRANSDFCIFVPVLVNLVQPEQSAFRKSTEMSGFDCWTYQWVTRVLGTTIKVGAPGSLEHLSFMAIAGTCKYLERNGLLPSSYIAL